MVLGDEYLEGYTPRRQLMFFKALDKFTFEQIILDFEHYIRSYPDAENIDLTGFVEPAENLCSFDVADVREDVGFFDNVFDLYDLNYVGNAPGYLVTDDFVLLHQTELFEGTPQISGVSGLVLSLTQEMRRVSSGDMGQDFTGVLLSYNMGGAMAELGSPLVQDLVLNAPGRGYVTLCNMFFDGVKFTFIRNSLVADAIELCYDTKKYKSALGFKIDDE